MEKSSQITKDISEEEFSTVIHHHSVNKHSAITYRTYIQLNKWPEDVRKTIFAALCNH